MYATSVHYKLKQNDQWRPGIAIGPRPDNDFDTFIDYETGDIVRSVNHTTGEITGEVYDYITIPFYGCAHFVEH